MATCFVGSTAPQKGGVVLESSQRSIKEVRPTPVWSLAHAVKSSLEMADRGFVTELTVFATNPKD
jgi:hypothetical protein